MTETEGRPAFVQDLLGQETRLVPAPLLDSPRRDLGTDGVSRERYTSKEYAGLEERKLWPHVWQMVCREEEIPAVGDRLVYEVAELSYVIVRAKEGIHAFVNSCLHRGTQLATGPGCAQTLRCPFHGFTWSLDGDLTQIPCEWDFPHVDRGDYTLPRAQVDTWNGFVFINPDAGAPSLTDYLGGLIEHFEPWPLEDRYLIANVARVVDCNWKVALEAFIEAYHTWMVHPQLLKSSGDTQTQYDVFEDEPHWSRMITPVGIPSEHIQKELSEQDIVNSMAMTHDDPTAVAEPGGARKLLAERMRESLTSRSGRDWSHVTDSEALDGIEYFVFPNFVPWAGFMTPLVYRFRPHGDDPGRSLLEVQLLEPVPAEGPRPEPALQRLLGADEGFADVPELGILGRILDQDVATFGRIQRGLKASPTPEVMFSQYQEVRLRHFHQVLGEYLGR